MRILLAGATGAIGRPLMTRLLDAGHEVVATTRDAARAAQLTAQGAEGVVLDALDPDAVRRVVVDARPEVVVHQLSSLPSDPADGTAMRASLARTSRLRRESVPAFAAAARDAGARRIVVQSISFVTAPTGADVVDEDHPFFLDAPADLRPVVETVRDMEAAVAATDGIEGVVLRYGFFYGPGTWYAADGAMADMLRRRRLPRIGNGEGRYSFIHVDAAADVTVAALDRGDAGVFNVCDGEPARVKDWMPEAVRALGAPRPLWVPAALARRVAGSAAVYYGTALRGASNAKMLAAFGVTPRPWREGLPAALRG
jgi:nucleoside-diphosphate-sugar epimerase